ncbi:hypothetical protein LCGC14_1308040 [marine sediment metagenome]|uniref:PIN domain-containing protein n=1 Tax=marine sediment metagenome TaxID=412755 RepID=A0A0F9KNP4_9ZZZZ
MTHQNQKNNEMKKKSPLLIFDTNIFLTGIDFSLFDRIIYTTPSIIKEIKVKKYTQKNQNILNKIYAAFENKTLIIKPPEQKYMQTVVKKSKLTGDYNALSDTDRELIALALELAKNNENNVKVFSNDYSLENVCYELNIPFFSLYKDGIKSKIIWEVYCPYCKKTHKVEDLYKTCEICGSKLKRRLKRNKIY